MECLKRNAVCKSTPLPDSWTITGKKFNCARLGKKTVLVTEDTEEHPGYSSTLEVSMKQNIFLYIFGVVDNCI